MNDSLKAKIAGKLGALPDDVGRQLLDYLEFLESKYNRSTRTPSTVQRITESLEDRIGGVRISDVAAKGTAQVMEAAGKLMEGLAAASRVIAEELEGPTAPQGGAEPDGTAEQGEPAAPSGAAADAVPRDEAPKESPPPA